MASLTDVLMLAALRERDSDATQRELRERDRAVGRRLKRAGMSVQDPLVSWARAVDPAGHARLQRAVGGARMIAVAAGAALGASAAWGVMRYDGSVPVNVLTVLGVLVLLPLVLAGVSLLTLLGRIPVFSGWLREAGGVGLLSPGGWVVRLVERAAGRGAGEASSTLRSQWRLVGGGVRASAFRWSQGAGLAFQLSALAVVLATLVTSDRAFGWGTTLAWEASDVAEVVRASAAPWGWAWPDAVPEAELVEQTRFFRGQQGLVIGGRHLDAEALRERLGRFGRWWPYVVMVLVVYGVGPRLLLWWAGRRWERRAVASTVSTWPDRSEVERRLWGGVETAGVGPGSTVEQAEASGGVRGAHRAAESVPPGANQAGPPAVVLAWSDVPGVDADAALAVGGGRSLADDQAAVAAAAGAVRDHPRSWVAVYVKAWEPPLGDLMDFLSDLRAALGDGVVVEVRGVGLAGTGEREGRPADAAGPGGVKDAGGVWRRRLAQASDPWLRYVDMHADAEADRGGS